eukprot:6179982-Pleurochrysis_carterae.AAC.11
MALTCKTLVDARFWAVACALVHHKKTGPKVLLRAWSGFRVLNFVGQGLSSPGVSTYACVPFCKFDKPQ